MILFDNSWSGRGGIGRFSDEISSRLLVKKVYITNKPASLLASIFISFYLAVRANKSLLFLPGFVPPLFFSRKYVFVIHDLNHLDRAENSSCAKKIFYNYVIKRGVYSSAAVLTVSEFSRNRIIEWSGVDANKVINVGNGVDKVFNTAVSPFEPGYPYLLCVSNRKLHKNEPMLINAFSQANVDRKIKLIMTGETTPELERLLISLDISKRIVFVGKVKDSELPGLYKGSLGLLFPSLYEGFGLPVVEAMACGVPVLTSNTTSLPEVAGDAALLVNPDSVDEISAGIERLVYDETLRAELIAKGLERAKLFSWDAVAARVQVILDEVTKAHGK